ncbi:hypothetical protein RJ492_001179 [Pluralibacter gergoviae]|uniref:DUF6881 domain-containing protein n=1 Tax=Pluralibacter gergoviae TaxID=61647 RepID=A0AAI9DRN4_PLUGE|nr:hypothetical protein [Pluralibacter gergoviae]EKV0918536.1 hypothetical protein [Pluralibacter gergoviae]EKV9911319.1 hypothetical protein [Pluralibacter gergoviae]EKW7277264.1 hypothetical protein [Pluralibacter gergoviae]ELD4295199.1 hypothetical protein [Pluralibacter gergoviae]ELD4309145.1 hypothetical protein [Pluralibacter gergoviae]
MGEISYEIYKNHLDTWRKKYPFEIYSELDDGCNEIRKVEIFSDGTVGYAEDNISHGKTRLGEVPVPSLQEINSDPQFKAEEITREYFLKKWEECVGNK